MDRLKSIHTYLERLQPGDRQITRGRTITETDLVNFSALTGDYFPLHTDAEYAGSTRFGQRIAHGMLVLSYTIGMLHLEPDAVLAFYGVEDLRFLLPTHIGDTIHAETEVMSLEVRSPEQGLSINRLTILNQRNEVILTATLKWLLAREEKTTLHI